MGNQLFAQAAHEVRMVTRPAVFDVEVDRGPVDAGEAMADLRVVPIEALVHHEDAIGPDEQLGGDGIGGKGGHAGGTHFVAGIVAIQRLRGRAAITVRGADEEDSFRHQNGRGSACKRSSPPIYGRRASGTRTLPSASW